VPVEGGGETYTGVPHLGQKVAPGGSSDPQLWQNLLGLDMRFPSRSCDLKHVIDRHLWESYLGINRAVRFHNKPIREWGSNLTANSAAGSSFPFLRLFAGLAFIAAGLLVYFNVNLGFSFALVFIVAGVAVVLIGFLGHRATAGDIALFIISLLVLAGAASSYNFATGAGHSYYVTKAQVSASHIAIDATTSFGSIALRFSNNADLAFQVVFGRTTAFPFSFPLVNQSTSFTNVTRGGVLFLNANSSTADITITMGSGYLVDFNASAGTGSVNLDSTSLGQKFGVVSISTGTGSIDARIDTSSISYLSLQGGTGSVNFNSNYLSTNGVHVPITVTTGTGSVNFNAMIPNNVGVHLSASNGFGSISRNLQGFTISQSSNGQLTASADESSAASFEVNLSVGTGSMSVDASIVSPQ